MPNRRSLAALGWGLAGLLAVSGTPAPSQDPDPDLLMRHLPADTWLTLELNDAAACYDALLGFLLPLPADLPPAIKLFAGAARLGAGQALGMPPREALAAIAPGRAVLAAVPRKGGLRWVLLAEHPDADSAAAGGKATEQQKAPPRHACHGRILAVAAHPAGLAAVAELRGAAVQVAAALEPGREFQLRVAVDAVRAARMASGKAGTMWPGVDPGGRFLLGPVLQAIDTADTLELGLRVESDALVVEGSVDASVLGSDLPSRAILGSGGKRRPVVAAPEGALAVAHLDRDLNGFFGDLDRLLDEGQAAQARAQLSVFGTIIGKRSVEEELLPGIGASMSFFVLPGEAAPDGPRMRLPSFALVAPLLRQESGEMLLRGASTLALISATQRKQRRLEPFRFQRRKFDGGVEVTTTLPEWSGVGAPPTEYGLSPTMRVASDHVILASTLAGAEAMVAALEGGPAKVTGDVVRLRGAPIAAALRDNLSLLVANNVLEKGERVAQARQNLAAVVAVAGAFEELELRVVPDDGGTRFGLTLRRMRQ